MLKFKIAALESDNGGDGDKENPVQIFHMQTVKETDFEFTLHDRGVISQLRIPKNDSSLHLPDSHTTGGYYTSTFHPKTVRLIAVYSCLI